MGPTSVDNFDLLYWNQDSDMVSNQVRNNNESKNGDAEMDIRLYFDGNNDDDSFNFQTTEEVEEKRTVVEDVTQEEAVTARLAKNADEEFIDILANRTSDDDKGEQLLFMQ